MTRIIIDALVPIFAGLLLGYLAGRRGLMDNGNVRNLIVLVMNFAIPCALFSIIIGTPRSTIEEQIPAAAMIALVFCVVFAGIYYWARLRLDKSVSDASVLALTIGFPNSAAVAIPLLIGTFGQNAAVIAALSIAVGSITISPISLALLEADKESAGRGVSLANIVRSFPRALARPVVWAPALALVGVCFDFHPPSYVDGTLTTLGSAASGSALILTGLVLSAQPFLVTTSVVLATVAKLAIQPAFALAAMLLFRMNHDQIRSITVVSAIPGGFFGLVFGKGFNSTPELASSSLIATYVAGGISLAIWILIVTRFF
jgi:malonate transporter